MLQRITCLIGKYKSVLSYLVFGILTTAVNYAVYFPLYNICGYTAVVSNAFSWLIAVIFAFLTNKYFVFKNTDWSGKNVFKELLAFVFCRAGSGLLETVVLYIFVDLLMFNGNAIKVILSVLIIILNYFSSKKIVFRK